MSVLPVSHPINGEAVERDVLSFIRAAKFEHYDKDLLSELTRNVFSYQFANNAPYRRFCEERGVTPESLSDWRTAPPVPTDVFKFVDLMAFPASMTKRTFKTSGTTRGKTRGSHHFSSLALYDEAILPSFNRFLLPDGARLPMLSLIPAPDELPDSSLSYMVDYVMSRVGAPGSRYFFVQGRLLFDELTDTLERFALEGTPVLILATAFALVFFLEQRPGFTVKLASGSRVMETGGMKGRGPEVGCQERHVQIESRLGIPPSHCVSEYGMTELSSQLYDSILFDKMSGREKPRALVAPPWLRVDVVDPTTLKACPEGQAGLIRFFDLANVHSVSAILTSDVGMLCGDGLQLLGRASGSEARGCSLTAEELLTMGLEQTAWTCLSTL